MGGVDHAGRYGDGSREEQFPVVVTGFYIDTYYTDSEKFVQEQAYKDCVYPTQQAFREDAHHLFDLNLLYSPWNKLFLTEYVKGNGIYFRRPSGMISRLF